ncbi:hypothetical protein AAZX31_08G159600 [Glycine max]|uniref:Uncharacterized protein n=2 Tax=Glycine subgen. Soja TaxID=1462606 RepID=A0A0R0IMT8_SOYBN|nr:hypothetical protein JHK85_021976 [Glycine max]KAG5025624.1 hypothetical protein JHK86_021538 [Glycine max]KAH1051507.1 hypothetical protein GYH30_021415 [Glycine max]KRH43622.1 hypothetical protein GLYMA_08G161200v4 [Glycine max]RZB97164.1 hypothetical protein D0Y65_020713 [Glycine soja]
MYIYISIPRKEATCVTVSLSQSVVCLGLSLGGLSMHSWRGASRQIQNSPETFIHNTKRSKPVKDDQHSTGCVMLTPLSECRIDI